MRVVEIFKSIDGEGKYTGKVATFVRLAGCNLRCVYCDTAYSFDVSKADEMSVEDIVAECQRLGAPHVTLTGGEPLIHKDVCNLILDLCAKGFEVNVETNGSVDLSAYLKMRMDFGLSLFFTVDYKCKYSGMNGKMCRGAFAGLNPKLDLVKCVVASKEDMDDALEYLDSFDKPFNIWFSPVFGAIEPRKIVEYVIGKGRYDITVQVQLHKIIWEPDRKGV